MYQIVLSSRSAVIAVLGAALLTACAATPPQVRVDSIEGQPPQCQTFAWNPDTSGDAASFNDQRMHNAVMQTLKSKGYTEAENADCRISYSLGNQQHHEPAKPRVGVGVGGGSYGSSAGIGISLPIGGKKGASGTLTLDVIDTAKKAQVWSGAMDANFKSGELTDEEANAAAALILAKYPDRTPK